MSTAELPQRLRRNAGIRRLVREVRLHPADFILPLFVTRTGAGPVTSMPDVARLTVSQAVSEAARAAEAGVSAVLLFGVPQHKDQVGSRALSPEGVVPEAVRAIKGSGLDIAVITDVCLCSYTSHGHCGILEEGRGGLAIEPTLERLAQVACVHADSGADVVAPSAMVDGQVRALRRALDRREHNLVPILAYSAKYASAFYGPFRDAAAGAPQFGDRKTHQMDAGNAREALREVVLDVAEGADMVMVKPALPYLDVIRRIAESGTPVPLLAYNVSGEYSMVKAAAAANLVDERQITLEILTAIRRAGADRIITYHALDAARWLSDGD